jgi:hypothetical protein
VNPASTQWTGSSIQENAGWIAGLLVIVAILAVGATFWFMYHPI